MPAPEDSREPIEGISIARHEAITGFCNGGNTGHMLVEPEHPRITRNQRERLKDRMRCAVEPAVGIHQLHRVSKGFMRNLWELRRCLLERCVVKPAFGNG